MAEDDKKPKIDLKARLGKKTVTGVGPSIPPPMLTPNGSIPAPPFAPSRAPTAPAFSEPPPAPVVVQPQAIKIEMSEEIVEQQKRDKKKWILVAAATAVVGGFLGSVVGRNLEKSSGYENALKGRDLLMEDVTKANDQIEKLGEVLKKAKSTLNDGKYPEAEINELGGINIPFDGMTLAGKGIGLMGPEINRLLVKFAGDSASANDQKDKLKRVLTGMRTQLTEILAEKDAPKVRWAVSVASNPSGPIAAMTLLPEAFPVKSTWPAAFEIPQGDKKVKLDRYTKGEPTSGSSPQLIPVDPASQTAVCPADTVVRVGREISGLEVILRGDRSDPTDERPGLIDTGTSLLEKLKMMGM